jgi:hypothetical protein
MLALLVAWLLIGPGLARGESRTEDPGLRTEAQPSALSTQSSSVPDHECHLYGLAEAEWAEVVTIIDSAIHGQRTFILIRTGDGCSCMLEGPREILVPTNGSIVKIYGLRLGIPGFTRLQLTVLEIEERT